jgi:hypothetical protein
VPDTKVIYTAVGSQEQFIEERDQPAKQHHLISHDKHIKSVQVDNSDSDEDDRLIRPAPSFFFVAIANPRVEPFYRSREGAQSKLPLKTLPL